MIRRYIEQVLHPERFHGHKRNGPFFEGWYYKLISADASQKLVVIPGIFRGEDPTTDHSFVQVLNGVSGEAYYYEYPTDAFQAEQGAFDVHIGKNHFQQNRLALELSDDQQQFVGELTFRNLTPWEVTMRSPGVMGPFAWVPNMACYHGVLSFNHEISGNMAMNGDTVNFDGGRGYLEKSWGTGYPPAHVWMQSNHFDTYGTSLETALAIMPSMAGMNFQGMQCGFRHGGELYKFTTYSGARLERFNITDHAVYITYRDRIHRLEITAECAERSLLHAPVHKVQHHRPHETLNATIHVHLTARVGNSVHTLYKGTGYHAGLEVHGDTERLLSYKR